LRADTESGEVRPKWSDGTPAYTKSMFGMVNKYNLADDFPITTVRNVPFKKCVDELLWIWQKNSNRVADLNSKIWDQWAGEDGTIGEAYGHILGLYHTYRVGDKYLRMTQVEKLIYDLKNNPSSRRMVTTMFDHSRLHKMNLEPCAYGTNFLVKEGRLNMVLIQRSNDFLVANSWNVTQYAVLVHLLAHCCDLNVGTLVHVITDAHIYDRHIDFGNEIITRESKVDKVKLVIDTEEKDFFKIKLEDIKLEGYESYKDKFLPVAE
ncbi:MAG: thymidylate synthase, partial [Paraclostridium sp.]